MGVFGKATAGRHTSLKGSLDPLLEEADIDKDAQLVGETLEKCRSGNSAQVGKCGCGFRGPSADTLKTIWLEKIKSEVSLQSKDIKKRVGYDRLYYNCRNMD
ncbi:hypothetical protein U1Q18_041218 [Sarracenia purpurea var. burkii]